MELGAIPKMEQFHDNNEIKVKQINEINKIDLLKSNSPEQTEFKVEKSAKVDEVEDTKSVQQIASEKSMQEYHAVELPSTSFGFNEESKDFYVKVTRGDAENQYPTEDMMKMKIYMKNLTEAIAEKQTRGDS